MSAGAEDNLILIGFMGSGKTSVGKKLAIKSERQFIDLDREIEREQRCSIAELFERVGEIGFRDIERDVLGHVEPARGLVVSCGGGIVLRDENRTLLPELGIVVWLHAQPGVLFERVSRADHRPLLNVDNPRARFDQLLADREALYRAVAHLEVDTSGMDHDQVTSEILRRLTLFLDEKRTDSAGRSGGI
jgi:shikimate kinase